jgi:glycine hydroxymethyltransferase
MNRIFQLTQTETERQKSTLNLIAAENYPSPKTLELLGSLWNDKYAEGYPGKRYYGGNVNAPRHTCRSKDFLTTLRSWG